jgi:hypothetical protein
MTKMLWKWKDGVQGAGYQKFILLNLKWPRFCDLMLIRYRVDAGLRPHRDLLRGKLRGWRHYRCNFLLWKAIGGEFIMHEGSPIFKFWRFVIFRADLYTHEITPVKNGIRYTLSFGLSLPPKKV